MKGDKIYAGAASAAAPSITVAIAVIAAIADTTAHAKLAPLDADRCCRSWLVRPLGLHPFHCCRSSNLCTPSL